MDSDDATEYRNTFGFHLMVDAYRCDPAPLDDLTACYGFLDGLVLELGVTKQSQPYLFRTPEAFTDKQGLSGWVPLVESGISLHTLTRSRFVSLDVYSCRRFDTERVVAAARAFFRPESVDTQFVLRGRRHGGDGGGD